MVSWMITFEEITTPFLPTCLGDKGLLALALLLISSISTSQVSIVLEIKIFHDSIIDTASSTL